MRSSTPTVENASFDAKPISTRSNWTIAALGSSWCVAANVTVPSPRHARNRQAMVYLLEPQLPWAAEDLVVDYELHGTAALMIAVKTEPLKEFIDRLEQLGGRIDSVTPLARLALATYLTNQPIRPPQCVLASAAAETVDLWLLDQGRPAAWYCTANNGSLRCVKPSRV